MEKLVIKYNRDIVINHKIKKTQNKTEKYAKTPTKKRQLQREKSKGSHHTTQQTEKNK